MASSFVRSQSVRRHRDPRLILGKFRGQDYWMEIVRRPVTRGGFLIMTEIQEPVTAYHPGDPIFKPLRLRYERHVDNYERCMASVYANEAEGDRRSAEIANEFEREISIADRGVIEFSMSGEKSGHRLYEDLE